MAGRWKVTYDVIVNRCRPKSRSSKLWGWHHPYLTNSNTNKYDFNKFKNCYFSCYKVKLWNRDFNLLNMHRYAPTNTQSQRGLNSTDYNIPAGGRYNNSAEQFKLTNIMDRRSGLHLDRPQNYTIVKMQGTVEFVFYAVSIPITPQISCDCSHREK